MLLSFPLSAQFNGGLSYDELYDSETVTSFKEHIRTLSSVSMEGRAAGSAGEREAALYVEECFSRYDIDIVSPKGGDSFGITRENGDTLTSSNVVGFVPGYDKELRNRYIVIGARMDNLGTMDMTIDGRTVTRVYNGANGNASGLAMMMELARIIKTNSILFRRSVLFVAFGASVETYAGAWYFLNRSFADADKIDAMINLDMVGTGTNGFYAYTSSNADMNKIIQTLSRELQPVAPKIDAEEPYPSDHRAFYDREIPSVLFTTGRYPEHNTDKDTEAIIDYDMMEKELEYVYNFSVALANEPVLLFRPGIVTVKGTVYEDVIPYYECDQKPMFLNSPDPRQFIEKWVYKYLKYPREAVQEGIQGRVMVSFVIAKDGSVTDVKVIKGVSPELDDEAVKVIAASPKWKPGRVNGNKVKSSMTIPVEFRLERKGKPSFGIKK